MSLAGGGGQAAGEEKIFPNFFKPGHDVTSGSGITLSFTELHDH